MPKTINTLQQVFVETLKDLYNAETQISKALPKMAKAATDPDLKKGFELHLEQTKEHVVRLEKICKKLGEKPTGKKCLAAAGLIAEGQEVIDADATPEMKDVMLIAAAQKVEHYEMSGYTGACSLARTLGLTDALKALSSTLSEEVSTEAKLSKASIPAIAQAANSEE